MIQGDTNFLWLKVDAANIKAFKDQVNTALVVRWFILSDNRRVDNAVVQAAAVFSVKVPVSTI